MKSSKRTLRIPFNVLEKYKQYLFKLPFFSSYNGLKFLHKKEIKRIIKAFLSFQKKKIVEYFQSKETTNLDNNTQQPVPGTPDNVLLAGYYITTKNIDISSLNDEENVLFTNIQEHIGICMGQYASPQEIIEEARELYHIELDLQDLMVYMTDFNSNETNYEEYSIKYNDELLGRVNPDFIHVPLKEVPILQQSQLSYKITNIPNNNTTPESGGIPIEYIVIGGIITVGLVGAVIYYFWWKRRKPPEEGINNTGSSSIETTETASDNIRKFSLFNKTLIVFTLMLVILLLEITFYVHLI